MNPRIKTVSVQYRPQQYSWSSPSYELAVRYQDHNGRAQKVSMTVQPWADIQHLAKDWELKIGRPFYRYGSIRTATNVTVEERCNHASLWLYEYAHSGGARYYNSSMSWNRSKGGRVPNQRHKRLSNLVNAVGIWLFHNGHPELSFIVDDRYHDQLVPCTREDFISGFKHKQWAGQFWDIAQKGMYPRCGYKDAGHCEDNAREELGQKAGTICMGFFRSDKGSFTTHVWNKEADFTELPGLELNYYVWIEAKVPAGISRDSFWDLVYQDHLGAGEYLKNQKQIA